MQRIVAVSVNKIMVNSLHYMYRVHCAVIFAIARLSCNVASGLQCD